MGRPRFFLIAILLPALLVAAVNWLGVLPLGVPGEWEWWRIAPTSDVAIALLPASMCAVLLIAFFWLGARRIERAGGPETCVWVTGLAVAGFGWLWVAQEAAPVGYGLSKAAWVLYYPGSSGYFTQARYGVRDTSEFLHNYEQLMSQGDVLHIGTHPPGLTVAYRLLMAGCRRYPALAAATLATQPETVQESFQVLEDNTRRSGLPLAAEDRAVLWMAALAVQAFAAAAVIPLFGVLRQIGGRGAAWRAAAFWPAVPAVCVFLPKADAMYPFWGMLILWIWHAGVSRHSRAICFCAGLVLCTSLFMTLAFLPCVLLAAIRTWYEGLLFPLFRSSSTDGRVPGSNTDFRPRSGSIESIGYAAAGFCVPIVLLYLMYDMNLIATWLWNFQNHAAFYTHYHRTWWKWLLVNPLELAVAAGVPLSMLVALSASLRRRWWNRSQTATAVAAGVTWGALLVSGKNMGEAARLWIFVIPWLILVAAPLFERGSFRAETPDESPLSDGVWMACLAGQYTFCMSLAACVVGFHPA